MKKIQVLIISIFFLGANVNASFLTPPQPYSFGPAGRTVSDLKDFVVNVIQLDVGYIKIISSKFKIGV